jgi:hypothetical protein
MDLPSTLGVLAVVLPSLYIYTTSVVSTRFPALNNKRICLLIAHPDDEAMFFSPAVMALTRPETGNHVKILCLSSGMFLSLYPSFTLESSRLTGMAPSQAMQTASERPGSGNSPSRA